MHPVDTSLRRATRDHCGIAGTRMSDSYERHFRFYDNREKYLLFVSTCSEKQVIAERVAMDISRSPSNAASSTRL